eukprot:6212339-Pleurochrysis_carterae.AAC.2
MTAHDSSSRAIEYQPHRQQFRSTSKAQQIAAAVPTALSRQASVARAQLRRPRQAAARLASLPELHSARSACSAVEIALASSPVLSV